MLKKADIPKPPAPTTSVKAPMKMGSTAVKMPKAKKLPAVGAKPSLFFKTENNEKKKNGVQALNDFIAKVKQKKSIKSAI